MTAVSLNSATLSPPLPSTSASPASGGLGVLASSPASSKVGALDATTISSPSAGTTTATKSTTSAAMGASKQEFLQLIIAEMKNQDPMAPKDSTAQITQLAQF